MKPALARREGALTCAWYGALFLASGAHLPYWPVWLRDWGLAEAEIGSYLGLAMVVRVIGATTLPALADHFAIRRAMLAAAALAAAVIFLAHLAIGARSTLFAATIAAALAMSPLIAVGEALGMRAAAQYGFAYAHARAVGSLAFLVMNVALGAAMAQLGSGAVLWAVALNLLLAAVLGAVHPGGGAPPGAGPHRARLRESLALLRHPAFLTFAIAISLGHASHAVYYAYSTLIWVGQGIGAATVGLLWGVGVVAEITLMLGPGRKLVARLGPARAVAIAALTGALRWGLMSLEPGLALLWPVQGLHALTFGLGHLGAIAFVAAAVPPRLQASAQGLYGGFMGGIAFALATLAAGRISAGFDSANAYLLAMAMSGLALGAALRLGRLWDGGCIVADQT